MSSIKFQDVVKKQNQKSGFDTSNTPPEDESTYKAFKTGLNGKAEIMININFKDKTSNAFPYFNIEDILFQDNMISIIRTNKIFTLKGKNLEHLIKYLLDHRITHIYEFNPDIFKLKPSDNQPIIHEIIVNEP